MRIVGVDLWAPQERRVEGETVRQVKDDFSRTSGDQFLTGAGGFWQVNFLPSHYMANVWQGIPRAEIEGAFQRAVASPEIAPHIDKHKLEITQSQMFPRVHCHLYLKPDAGVSDQELYRAFESLWPSERIPIPPLTIGIDVSRNIIKRDKAVPPGAASVLRRLFEVHKDGMVHVRSERMDDGERSRLKKWAAVQAPGSQKQPPARQLLALLSSSTDLSTERGRETIAAMKDLQLFSPFWNRAFDILAARFKPRALEHSMFIYNGHPTFSMTSLLPALNAFAPESTNIWMSKRSGTPEAREIIRIQKPTAMFSESKFSLGAMESVQHRDKTIADLLDHRMRMPQGQWGSDHMIVDKLGPWLERLGGKLPAQVRLGWVRAIVHNRDDLDALRGLENQISGIDFANSEVKKTEAYFLGEQYALMGAREARLKGWGRIGDVPVVINGFGLLGEQTALALSRLGMPRDRILIRDRDPNVLERAKAAGFAIEGPRPERAVVFNATPGVGIDAGTARTFGDDLIVLSMTSGGKGVDLRGLRANAQSIAEVPVGRRSQLPIRDLDLEVHGTHIRLIAEGSPPNLVDEMWADRYQLTSIGVTAATLLAAEHSGKGIIAFDEKLDRELVETARACGLMDKRPLDARPGEDPRDLLADLDAFAPAKP